MHAYYSELKIEGRFDDLHGRRLENSRGRVSSREAAE